jgi:tetratricopeptide (TPR) repeat protein
MVISASAQKYEKALEKAESYYIIGDYQKALKTYTKNQLKIAKKIGSQNDFYVQNKLGEVNCQVSLGNVSMVPGLVEELYSLSKDVNADFPGAHARTCIGIAEIWLEYGHTLKTKEFLDKAKALIEEEPEKYRDQLAAISVYYAKVYTARGYYRTALEYIDSEMDYFLGRAVKKETIVDATSGTLNTIKLDKSDWLPRMRNAADLLTLKAYTLNKMGRFLSSDSAFQYADNWIDNNLSRGDIKYLENLYYWAEMLEDNGVESLPIKYYEKVNTNIVRQSKPTHLLNTKTQHRLIRAYQREDDQAKMNRQISAFDGLTKKYFGKRNIHYMRFDALELDVRLAANKTKRLTEKANKMLKVTSTLPLDHPLRIEINEFLYAANLVNENYDDAEQNLKEILIVQKFSTFQIIPKFEIETGSL